MRKKILTIITLALLILTACAQKPAGPTTPIEDIKTEEQQPEQICTEKWLCQDENTKAYRKPDCTFEQITDCPAGCENAECKEEIIEEKEEETELGELKEEPEQETGKCTIGFKCLDEKRRGYQSSNCVFSNVDECKYGCKDDECIIEAPKEEEKEESFFLTERKLTMNKTGWKFTDFDEGEIFQLEINDYDFKIKLYASASGYNYYRAESYRSDLWIIEKGITEATRSDCVENIIDANAYYSLRTGQTLCIETREDDIALLGGYWEGLPKEDTELTWKYYTPK